jgi:hypothetical protein
MRKILITVIILSILFLLSFQTQLKPTNSELKTTCIVLAKLTDNAIENQRNDLVTLYLNTYKAMREEHNFSNSCDKYFDDIKSIYGNSLGVWGIYSEFPPRQVESAIVRGNYTHKEIIFMEQLKSYSLFETDFHDILLFMDIKRGQINVENIKKTDVKEWNNTINKIKDLKLDEIELKLIDELSKPIYNINEFKQNVEQR